MKKNILRFILFFVMIILLTACKTNNNSQNINSGNIDENTSVTVAYPEQLAYPPKPIISEPTAYPADFFAENTPVAYPINTPTRDPRSGPKFEINEPVFEGSTQVSGTGPANVPILLVNVTEMGEIIAETTINSHGVFTFEFQNPLKKGNAVGLQIGDLSKTDFNYNDFIYGEDYIDKPLIGILFDMASVIEKN